MEEDTPVMMVDMVSTVVIPAGGETNARRSVELIEMIASCPAGPHVLAFLGLIYGL